MSKARLEIASRFRRSANLEHDTWAPDALHGYVISQLARDVGARMSQELAAANGGRAFSIVGPYGSGKSSFLTFMLRLWMWEPLALEKLRHDDQTLARQMLACLDDFGGTILPIVVTGERSALGPAILRAISRAADRVWSGKGKRPDIVRVDLPDALARFEAGEPVPDHVVAEILEGFATKVRDSARGSMAGAFAGVVLVIDEMGKHLEWAALNPERSDLYLLQVVAERATRLSAARLAIVTVLHQELVAYADGLPRSMREEWSKIGGRFESVPYLESPRHLTGLIAGALVLDAQQRSGSAYTRAEELAARLAAEGPAAVADAPLTQCFPLHPFTALILGPLFRRRVSQNERSLFAFLASHEPFGFQDWLSRADLDVPADGLYRVDTLYDYVVANVGTRMASEPGERTWSVAETALTRLPEDSAELDARLVKVIALLSLVGASVGLRPDRETLADACLTTIDETGAALERLVRASVCIYKSFKGAFQLWDGSDIDVSSIVSRNRLRVEARGGFAETLNRLCPPEPIVATRLAYTSGVLRVLSGRYSAGVDTAANKFDTDGLLLRVLPDRPSDIEGLRERLSFAVLSASERPVLYTLPSDPRRLYEVLLDWLAILETQASTAELESDPVARRELEERRLGAFTALQAALETSYAQEWWFGGRSIPVSGRPSKVASEVLGEVFASSPPVRNELLNRAELSSAATAARRELMSRMLTDAAQFRLGIEGSPPELSMYRSFLETSGIHRPADPSLPDGAWCIGPPPGTGPFSAAWNRVGEILQKTGGRRLPFASLINELARPPYGVRPGVAPLLVFSWFVVHADVLFWYELNSFVTTFTPDHLHRLLRKYDDFEVQLVAGQSELDALLAAFSRAGLVSGPIDGRTGPLKVVRALVKVISGLSFYAGNTQRIEPRTRKLRAALKSARDPVRLLTESLPEALELSSPGLPATLEDPAFNDEYATRLRLGLRELARADARLHAQIEATIATLLGAPEPGTAFLSELASRAHLLVQARVELPPTTRRIADLSTALDGTPEVRDQWIAGIGTAILGKVPSQWTDADFDRFRMVAAEPCRGFIAAEQLALELGKAGSDAVHLVRLSLLDNRGHHRVAVGVLREDEVTRVEELEREVARLAESKGISPAGLAYAFLAGIMGKLARTAEAKDAADAAPQPKS
jgi:hypothetical protein